MDGWARIVWNDVFARLQAGGNEQELWGYDSHRIPRTLHSTRTDELFEIRFKYPEPAVPKTPINVVFVKNKIKTILDDGCITLIAMETTKKDDAWRAQVEEVLTHAALTDPEFPATEDHNVPVIIAILRHYQKEIAPRG